MLIRLEIVFIIIEKEDTCDIAVGNTINLQSEYADAYYFKGHYRSDNI